MRVGCGTRLQPQPESDLGVGATCALLLLESGKLALAGCVVRRRQVTEQLRDIQALSRVPHRAERVHEDLQPRRAVGDAAREEVLEQLVFHLAHLHRNRPQVVEPFTGSS